MIKRNNKGFTLLELLISIFLLTTVIFIGYKVLDKSTMDITNQGNINKGQLTMNDMNEYLTKDLEQASSIALFLNGENIADTMVVDNNREEYNREEKQDILKEKATYLRNELDKLLVGDKFTYSYRIRFKEHENNENNPYRISYNVDITKDKNNYKYSISRKEEKDKVLINFINDERLKEKELPFTIEGNSPYSVTLGYNGKNNKFVKHEFTVTYRLNEITNDNNTIPPEQEAPPSVEDIKPPEEWEDKPNQVMDYNVIGFWTADANKKTEDNLYTWVSTYGEILGEAYADQINGKNDKFNIEGFARPENKGQTASYIGYNTIDKDKDWKGQVRDVYIGEKNIVKISIYVSPHTKLEKFKIQKLQGNANIQISETLNEGWHHCTIATNSQVSFEFKGELSIDKSKVNSGYAYVVYEREDSSSDGNTSDLRGDLILEITKNNSQNTGQYNWGEIIKGNLIQNPVIGEQQSLTEFKDRPFHLYIGKHENKLRPSIDGMGYDIYNSKICNIVGMRVRLDGDIKLKFDNFYDKENNSILDNPQKVYEFELPNKDYNISGKIDILKNVPLYNTSRIIVDFIYN